MVGGRPAAAAQPAYTPPSVPTWTLIAGSAVGAGPDTTAAARDGSRTAPWHGHESRRWLASYPTWQPACVQTASNATTLPLPSETATAGSPLAGSGSSGNVEPGGRSATRSWFGRGGDRGGRCGRGCVRLACRGRWPGPIGDLLKPGIDECGAQEVAQRQGGVARPPIVGGRFLPRNWLDALLPHGCDQYWQGLLGVP